MTLLRLCVLIYVMEVTHFKAKKDMTRLLAGIPRGSWVALCPNDEVVLGYADDLDDAQRIGQQAGEPNPLMVRVPPADVAWLF